MGALTLPDSGQVYFDANCLIYSVEKIEPYHKALEAAWLAADSGRIRIVSSELVVLETLVKPMQEKDALMESLYRDLLLGTREVRLIPIGISVLDRAARIRAETGIKAPDAIHAATTLEAAVTRFMTNDHAFRRVSGLPVTILSDVLAA